MKRILCTYSVLLFATLVSFLAYGQENLILNPGFEELNLFKAKINFVTQPSDNELIVSDTSLFWGDSSKTQVWVISKHWQYADTIENMDANAYYSDKGFAHSGNLFSIINSWVQVNDNTCYIRNLVATLKEPLVKGNVYKIGFFIKPLDGNIKLHQIGISPIKTPLPYLVYYEDCRKRAKNPNGEVNYPVSFINVTDVDTGKYQYVETLFTALGDEKFVLIGNPLYDKPNYIKVKTFGSHYPNTKLPFITYAVDDVFLQSVTDVSLNPKDITKENCSQTVVETEHENVNTRVAEGNTHSTSNNICQSRNFQNVYKIHFEEAMYSLNPDARSELDVIIELLKVCPDIKVIINGYADPRGTSESNKKLSEQRARSVYNYIRGQINDVKNNIKFIGLGESSSYSTHEENRIVLIELRR